MAQKKPSHAQEDRLRLLFERLRLFFYKEPFWRLIGRWLYRAVLVDRHETERVGALAPVEDVGVPRRFAPIDQGRSGVEAFRALQSHLHCVDAA